MNASLTLPVICCGPRTEPLAGHERDVLAARFKALADPTRVAIVNCLSAADGVCVGSACVRRLLQAPSGAEGIAGVRARASELSEGVRRKSGS